MHKEIKHGAEAREEISKGIQTLTDAVSVTMGPMGRNVLIHEVGKRPYLTKDGVTVAQQVFLENKLQDIGAQIVKEVSANTAFEAGDGTTTSTVLANKIFQKGLKLVREGIDINKLKRGMDHGVENLVRVLKENSREIREEDVINVATISANGDERIGKMISDAIKIVGTDGIITIEENTGVTDELVITEGMEFNRGFISPHFITNPERNRAELVDPLILVTDGKISQLVNIIHILEKVQKTQRPLLIVADEIDGEALSSIIVNKMRGVLEVYPVKAPGFGAMKDEILKDICLFSGASLISESVGKVLAGVELSDLGSAKKVLINSNSTVIVNGSQDRTVLNQTVSDLKAQSEFLDDGEHKNQIKKRIARLNGGAATIKVGAQTEFEMSEKKDRFDDAVEATKSAISEGIVVGGGCALLHASNKLKKELMENDYSDENLSDEWLAKLMIYESALEPFYKILENAGVNLDKRQELYLEISRIKENSKEFGYNVVSGHIENFFNEGIIDPLKVERIALINANSIASMLLTTEVAIYEETK